MEPDKCEGWFWKSWAEVRQLLGDENGGGDSTQQQKLFLPIVNLLRDHADVENVIC